MSTLLRVRGRSGAGVPVWRTSRFRGRDLLDAVVTLPLVLPPTVLGYYLLVLLGRKRGSVRFTSRSPVRHWCSPGRALWSPRLLHSAPLLIKTSRAALESVDHSYERAARVLGASEWRLFWIVTLPLAWRSILAGALFALLVLSAILARR